MSTISGTTYTTVTGTTIVIQSKSSTSTEANFLSNYYGRCDKTYDVEVEGIMYYGFVCLGTDSSNLKMVEVSSSVTKKKAPYVIWLAYLPTQAGTTGPVYNSRVLGGFADFSWGTCEPSGVAGFYRLVSLSESWGIPDYGVATRSEAATLGGTSAKSPTNRALKMSELSEFGCMIKTSGVIHTAEEYALGNGGEGMHRAILYNDIQKNPYSGLRYTRRTVYYDVKGPTTQTMVTYPFIASTTMPNVTSVSCAGDTTTTSTLAYNSSTANIFLPSFYFDETPSYRFKNWSGITGGAFVASGVTGVSQAAAAEGVEGLRRYYCTLQSTSSVTGIAAFYTYYSQEESAYVSLGNNATLTSRTKFINLKYGDPYDDTGGGNSLLWGMSQQLYGNVSKSTISYRHKSFELADAEIAIEQTEITETVIDGHTDTTRETIYGCHWGQNSQIRSWYTGSSNHDYYFIDVDWCVDLSSGAYNSSTGKYSQNITGNVYKAPYTNPATRVLAGTYKATITYTATNICYQSTSPSTRPTDAAGNYCQWVLGSPLPAGCTYVYFSASKVYWANTNLYNVSLSASISLSRCLGPSTATYATACVHTIIPKITWSKI